MKENRLEKSKEHVPFWIKMGQLKLITKNGEVTFLMDYQTWIFNQ